MFNARELQARKQALFAESEVYRESLKLQIQNVRLYQVRMQRKLELLRTVVPLVIVAGSALRLRDFRRPLMQKPRSKWRRGLGLAIMGWRLFRQYSPLAQTLLHQFRVRRTNAHHAGGCT
jgi:hypothetical protein